MRLVFRWLVALCVAYFVVGYLAVKVHWLSADLFYTYAPVAGVLGSVLGLSSFSIPAVASSDLRSVEIDALKNISATIQKLDQQGNALSGNAAGEAQANLQKVEIATLIRKISLSLFLQDQGERLQTEIIDIIQANPVLRKHLDDFKTVKKKLGDLDEEINLSAYMDIVTQILESEKIRDRYAALSIDERILVTGYNLLLRNLGFLVPSLLSRLFR